MAPSGNFPMCSGIILQSVVFVALPIDRLVLLNTLPNSAMHLECSMAPSPIHAGLHWSVCGSDDNCPVNTVVNPCCRGATTAGYMAVGNAGPNNHSLLLLHHAYVSLFGRQLHSH